MNIPGFEIRYTLGKGGMATVYLAEQLSLGREVALKIMAADLVQADRTFCDRFIKEGRIIARLRHRHVITIHDIGCIDGSTYYMSMEYCSGGTLKEKIKDGLDGAQALRILREIASALGYAHSQGFVHRDIKPANILFRDDDSAVLSDFGIAKTMDDRTQLTQLGWAIGTPEYMSPEQSAGRPLTGAADLYSLGVVLYEMLTGRKPFVGTDPLSTAMQHAQKPVPRLPSEHLHYQHVLDSLMAKDVKKRCSDADELIAEIDRLIGFGQGVPDEGATRPLSPGQLSAHGAAPGRRMLVRGLGLVMGLGFAVISGIAAWQYLGPGGSAPAKRISQPVTEQPEQAGSLTPEQQEKLERLLNIARAHVSMGRLQDPPGSNAYEAYELVLELDPGNQEALVNRREIEALASQDGVMMADGPALE